MNWLLSFIGETLLQEFIAVVAALLLVRFGLGWWEERRYGNWYVIVKRGDSSLLRRAISARKLREIQEETSDLAVFLKGVASPYAWIKCDLIEDGEPLGLLEVDHAARTYTLKLENNPKPEPKSPDEITQQFAREGMPLIEKQDITEH